MATARKYILAAHFQGAPKRSDLKIVEEKLPTLQDGGQLLTVYYIMQGGVTTVASVLPSATAFKIENGP